MIVFDGKSTLLEGWKNSVSELSFGTYSSKPLTWGLAVGYREPIHLHFSNVLNDGDLQLDMAGFTIARWTRLMNLYFRSDLEDWISESAEVLDKYAKRPIVRGYQPNRKTEHSHGSCLQAVNLRLCPSPNITIVSRACLLDRTGLIDLAVMNTITRYFHLALVETDPGRYIDVEISGDWFIFNPYINSFTQAFHLLRFGQIKRDLSNARKVLANHVIGDQVLKVYDKIKDYESIKYGPMKRAAKRIISWSRDGCIHRNKAVRELTFDVIKSGGLGDRRDADLPDV